MLSGSISNLVKKPFAYTLGIAVLLALFWWQLRLVGNIRIDDAYITFSYSKNLALGNGPVYSHGVRVEGYSNFLWMLLVAIPLRFRATLDPYLLSRILTVPFAVLLGVAVWSLVGLSPRLQRGRWAVTWIALVLMVIDTDMVVAAICGLETLPYIALLVAGFALHLRAEAGSAHARRLTIPCFVAAALMRIDGVAPLAFILAWETGSSILGRRFDLRVWLRWAGPGVAVYVLWFAWRWGYYRLPLPTTYYAKALIPKALPDRGMTYARDFWTSTGLIAAVPLALAAFAAKPRRPASMLGAYVVLHTAYVIRVGGDWMPFGRFLLQIVPFVLVLAAWGTAYVVERAWRFRRPAGVAAAFGAAAVMAWMGRRADGHSAETKQEREKLDVVAILSPVIENNFLPGSRLLNHVVKPGQRLVSDYAGVMAYFTQASMIDMWGLANEEIALKGTTEGVNPIWGRTCPPCYATLDPDFFHVPSVSAPNAYRDERSVVAAVWQSGAIGRYVDFRQFVAGRVTDLERKQSMFFLERRRPGSVFETRRPARDIVVEYPFVAGRAVP